MCFSKILSPRLRTIIQVILISVLHVRARIVFFQAILLQKKDRSATTWCPPIKSLSLFLCVHIAKQIKNKRQKSKNNIRVALRQKTAGKKRLIFQKFGHKWSIPRTEPQNTKNIQKLPFLIIRVFLCRKLLKTHLILEKWLDVEKWQNVVVRQSSQKRFISLQLFCRKIGLKAHFVFKIMMRFWKVAKMANLANWSKWFILGLTFKVQKTTLQSHDSYYTQKNAQIQT